MCDPSTIELFGLPLVNASSLAALDWLEARLTAKHKTTAYFINAHCINQTYNSGYSAALRRATLLLPDGSGLAIAARLRGHRFVANLNGTDLVPQLCGRLARSGGSVFLLGAAPGVAEAAAAGLAVRYPGLRIAGACNGYFTPEEEPGVIAAINTARTDLLLVAFGVPKQELWIDRHLAALDVGVAMGVGALFDFVAERAPRAPLTLRRLGLEWLYRLYHEPRRLWRRYLIGNANFLIRAVMDALRAR